MFSENKKTSPLINSEEFATAQPEEWGQLTWSAWGPTWWCPRWAARGLEGRTWQKRQSAMESLRRKIWKVNDNGSVWGKVHTESLRMPTTLLSHGKDTHCASASWSPWRGPTSSERQKAELRGQSGSVLDANPGVTFWSTMVSSVPNESLSIWLNKRCCALPCWAHLTRASASSLFHTTTKNHQQPVAYLMALHVCAWREAVLLWCTLTGSNRSFLDAQLHTELWNTSHMNSYLYCCPPTCSLYRWIFILLLPPHNLLCVVSLRFVGLFVC